MSWPARAPASTALTPRPHPCSDKHHQASGLARSADSGMASGTARTGLGGSIKPASFRKVRFLPGSPRAHSRGQCQRNNVADIGWLTGLQPRAAAAPCLCTGPHTHPRCPSRSPAGHWCKHRGGSTAHLRPLGACAHLRAATAKKCHAPRVSTGGWRTSNAAAAACRTASQALR